MSGSPDVEDVVRRLLSGASVAEQRALLDGLLSGRVSSLVDRLRAEPVPSLGPISATPRGFQVRLELRGSKPPVWRRLVLPGDLTLPRVHDVIQAAMGWQDSHLHRFRTDRDPRCAHFVTQFDLEEGDDGYERAYPMSAAGAWPISGSSRSDLWMS